jgi:NAD(P)-dependent dehydrogenase (short-subunit alcohol dehydrogenase family)
MSLRLMMGGMRFPNIILRFFRESCGMLYYKSVSFWKGTSLMQGKVCLVTGANSGIGKITALELAKMGATVVMTARNRAKGEAAQAEIKAQSGNQSVDLLLADFASLQETRRLAEEFKAKYPRLDVLVNNAGLYLAKRLESTYGYEMTFAVNHLAPFLLTNLLLDVLKASAPARVITVSSAAHGGVRMDFDNLQNSRGYSGFRAYGQSKLANILFTYELSERLKGTGVMANCLHPGGVSTNFASNNSGLFGVVWSLLKPFLRSPEQGAETSIYLASSPDLDGVTGKYFVDKTPVMSSRESYKRESWKKLWQVSEELVGLHSPDLVAAR